MLCLVLVIVPTVVLAEGEFELQYITAVGNSGGGNWMHGEDWNVESSDNIMTEVEPGVWEITYTGIDASDNYVVRFVCNGSWSTYNWSIDGILYGQDNPSNVVSENDSSVTLRIDVNDFDFAKGTGTVYPEFIVKAPGSYTVTFYRNGGTGTIPTQVVRGNGNTTEPTAPTAPTGYTFEGWYEKDAEGNFGTNAFDFDTTPITADTKLYAKWECAHQDENPKDHKCDLCGKTISTCSGGTATCQDKAVCKHCEKPYGELDPTNHVGTLGEWQKNASEHWQVYSECKHETTHEPHDYDADGKCICSMTQYTITFDVGEGTVDTKTMVTDTSGKLSSLPTPTRKNHNFLGWFTKSGEMITIDTVFTEPTTVYAHWQIQSSSFLPTWQQWELIDKIVAANKKKE